MEFQKGFAMKRYFHNYLNLYTCRHKSRINILTQINVNAQFDRCTFYNSLFDVVSVNRRKKYESART